MYAKQKNLTYDEVFLFLLESPYCLIKRFVLLDVPSVTSIK
jgi:hypothetical protein